MPGIAGLPSTCCRWRKIGNTRVDMVLIDIAMPEINGVEALATMLKKRPEGG